MINLRYHIVSITAVFLALAIGVVMGTSFLGKASIDQLKTQIRGAETGIRNTKRENFRLATEIKRIVDREDAMREQGPQLLAGRLIAQPVLIIAADGVDRDSLAALQSTLEVTGADFKGTLVATSKLRLAGDDVSEMSELLGTASTSRRQVRRLLVDQVAQMLSTAGLADPTSGNGTSTGSTTSTTRPGSPAPSTTQPAPRSTTTTSPLQRRQLALLTDLRDGGWLSYQPPVDGTADETVLTTGGYRYVVVSGPDVATSDSQFLRPVWTALATDGPAPVVVASAAVGDDPERTRRAVVGPIRDNDPLNKNLSTVDDLESFDGLAAVVLALEDLNEIHGHYGVGGGATSLLPPPP